MKKYILFSTLTLLLAACSSNEQIESEVAVEDVINSTIEEAEKREAEKEERKAELEQENQIYLENIGKHMESFINEGDYISAILMYDDKIKNTVSVEADENIILLYQKAVEGYELLEGEKAFVELDYSILADKPSEASREIEEIISTTQAVHPDVLYDYVQEQFNILTNYGDNYVPEIHDPIVMEKAAHTFNITLQQAEKLYYEGAGL